MTPPPRNVSRPACPSQISGRSHAYSALRSHPGHSHPGHSHPGPGRVRGQAGGRRACPRVPGPPLPDPDAVRLCPVPDSAPPYDDELLPPCGTDRGPGPPGRYPGRGCGAGRPAGPGRPRRPQARRPGPGRRAGAGQASTARLASTDRAAWAGPGRRAGPAGRTGPASRTGTGPADRQPQPMARGLGSSRRCWWKRWPDRGHHGRCRAGPLTVPGPGIPAPGPMLVAGEEPRLRRVVAFRPASHVIDMTVVVSSGSWVRAPGHPPGA